MRKRRRPQPFDALAPVGPREQRRQAQRDLKASYNPLAKMINRSASASAKNIAGVYGRLAGDLGAYRQTEQDIYGRARTALEAANTGAAAGLGQTASSVGGALQAALAASGQSADQGGQGTAGYQGDVTRLQAGQASRGGAALSELALRGAAAENYAAQLPQFARLAGGQAIQESEARRRRDISDLSAKAQSQLADALSSRHRLEYEKAVASRGLGLDYAKLDADAQQAAAAEAGRNARNAASNQSREAIAAANRRAAKARAILAEGGRNARARAQAARQGRALDEQQSAQRGVLVDKQGRVIKYTGGPKKGKPIPYSKKKHVGGKGSGGGGGGSRLPR